jgi:hypothetical protein
VADPRERAGIALELAQAHAALFRWVNAVDVLEEALAGLGDADGALATRLEGELAVCGLHDARRAARALPCCSARTPRRPRAKRWPSRGGWRASSAGRRRRRSPRDWRRRSRAPVRRSRTGTRARRCCGCWSPSSASTPSRRRSRRCWRRSAAPGRRAASSPPTARSDCCGCGSARSPTPTRRRAWRWA